MLSNKRILITGGAGFIGSHLVDRFVKEGAEEVIVYDNFCTGNRENLKDAEKSGRVTIIEGDILDYDLLKRSIEGVDLVSHHAAELEVFTGIEDPTHDLRTNIEGTLNVVKACLENDVLKLIYASSGGVYGPAKYLPEDEEHPTIPQWPYGVSKLAGERYCTMASQLYGLPTVSLRYSIVYGPREWYGRVLTLFIKRVSEGLPPVIFGDGLQTRDYVYISDAVDANLIFMKKRKGDGDYFNIGSGVGTSIKELAEIVLKTYESDLRPIYDDPKPGTASKYQKGRRRLIGELRDFVLDIKKASKIGFSPKISVDKGVREEIEWYSTNKKFWDYPPRV